MLKPHELRAKAAQHQVEAKAIYERAKAAEAGMSDADAVRYDELLTSAETAIAQAATDEARTNRMNELEERSKLVGGGSVVSPPLPHNDPGNTRGGRHQFSVVKALRENLAQREGTGRLTGVELETHQELVKLKSPNSPVRGVLVPWDVPFTPDTQKRAFDATAGAGSIPTILASTMIDVLRARMVSSTLGATVMADMQGLFAIPRQSGVGAGYWLAEGGAPTTSGQTVDQVAFTPKTVGAFTDYTRRLLEQTNLDAEAFVKNDLMSVLARAVEIAQYNGSGASNQPKGILPYGGNVTTVAIGTNGGNPTWANLVAMESAISAYNADQGNLAYVTTSACRGFLKTAPKIGSTFPIFLWDGSDTPLNGYPAAVTNLLPSNLTKGSGTNLSPIIFGNWADLITVFWSGIDLMVDPYTNSSSGAVRIVALQDCDINLRHPESFSVIKDAVTV